MLSISTIASNMQKMERLGQKGEEVVLEFRKRRSLIWTKYLNLYRSNCTVKSGFSYRLFFRLEMFLRYLLITKNCLDFLDVSVPHICTYLHAACIWLSHSPTSVCSDQDWHSQICMKQVSDQANALRLQPHRGHSDCVSDTESVRRCCCFPDRCI